VVPDANAARDALAALAGRVIQRLDRDLHRACARRDGDACRQRLVVAADVAVPVIVSATAVALFAAGTQLTVNSPGSRPASAAFESLAVIDTYGFSSS